MGEGWIERVALAALSVIVIIAMLKMSQLLEKAKNFVAGKMANVKMPKASVKDVNFKPVSLDYFECRAKVSVSNPYPFPLPITKIKYSLKSAGSEIASGVISDPSSLKANDTTIVDVMVKVQYSVLISLSRDIVKDWDIDCQLDLGLIIDLPAVGNITIPLSYKREIKLPTPADIKLPWL